MQLNRRNPSIRSNQGASRGNLQRRVWFTLEEQIFLIKLTSSEYPLKVRGKQSSHRVDRVNGWGKKFIDDGL